METRVLFGTQSDQADMKLHILGESPKLSQAALCCLISVCHAKDLTQPLVCIIMYQYLRGSSMTLHIEVPQY